MSEGDGGRISHRIEDGHWLLVDGFRRITGCHCGFVADPDENGYGDSVIDHIEAVVRAECARELEATRARLAGLVEQIERHAGPVDSSGVRVGVGAWRDQAAARGYTTAIGEVLDLIAEALRATDQAGDGG